LQDGGRTRIGKHWFWLKLCSELFDFCETLYEIAKFESIDERENFQTLKIQNGGRPPS